MERRLHTRHRARTVVYISAPGSRGKLCRARNLSANGVFIARASSNFSLWTAVSSGLPNVPVFELDYEASSGTLIAATLGRGAWRLRPFLQEASPIIFRNGFE